MPTYCSQRFYSFGKKTIFDPKVMTIFKRILNLYISINVSKMDDSENLVHNTVFVILNPLLPVYLFLFIPLTSQKLVRERSKK